MGKAGLAAGTGNRRRCQSGGEISIWLAGQKGRLPALPELAADIAGMRRKLAASQPGFWQMKQQAGGLLDGEFLDGLLAAEAQQKTGKKTRQAALDLQANLARQAALATLAQDRAGGAAFCDRRTAGRPAGFAD